LISKFILTGPSIRHLRDWSGLIDLSYRNFFPPLADRVVFRLVATDKTLSKTTPAADPDRWVDDHGDCLYRYALARVRTPEVAQDLVQEVFLAALRSSEKFEGRSSERSWLCGILKNKIIDYYRKLGRETSFTDMESLSDDSDKFVPEGWWIHANGPKDWKPAPDVVAHRSEFWATMRRCLGKLPDRIANVFMLREMEELSTKEICETLTISESNLGVMLHRSRLALRECLEMNWFEKEKRNATGKSQSPDA
jgi:RNA polymerase sigma-70 factor (TIGR02943 family)